MCDCKQHSTALFFCLSSDQSFIDHVMMAVGYGQKFWEKVVWILRVEYFITDMCSKVTSVVIWIYVTKLKRKKNVFDSGT